MIDQDSVSTLQKNLVSLMMSAPKQIADQYLEIIALMSKRFVHEKWPNLIPVRLPRLFG